MPVEIENWRVKAACTKAIEEVEILESAWIQDDDEELGEVNVFRDEAKRICLGCEVRNKCLQNALDDDEAQGMRGGYWFDFGRLPVAQAREIRDTMDLEIRSHQSTGRPKS